MKSREDWLCDQLDNENLSESLRKKYEAELDSIADRISNRKQREKQTVAEREAYLKDIRDKILSKDADFISEFGREEFGDDYETTQEGTDWVIYSKVSRDDQEHRRVHSSLEAAQSDLRYLYYNRLYDRYVRTGEMDRLKELI